MWRQVGEVWAWKAGVPEGRTPHPAVAEGSSSGRMRPHQSEAATLQADTSGGQRYSRVQMVAHSVGPELLALTNTFRLRRYLQ